jgi:hypothetical protein
MRGFDDGKIRIRNTTSTTSKRILVLGGISRGKIEERRE